MFPLWMMAAQKAKGAKDSFAEDPNATENSPEASAFGYNDNIQQGKGQQANNGMNWGDWMAIGQAAKQMNQNTTATIEGENRNEAMNEAAIKGQFIRDYAGKGGSQYPLYMLQAMMKKKPKEDEFFLDKFHGHKLLGSGLNQVSEPTAKRWNKAHEQ